MSEPDFAPPHLVDVIGIRTFSEPEVAPPALVDVIGTRTPVEPDIVQPSLVDVVRRFGLRYLGAHGSKMPWIHKEAMSAILRCRTPAMGGHVDRCDRCGEESYVFHSCRHKACLQCHRGSGQKWLDSRREELLPVPYFHVVFTVPQALRRHIRKHQHKLYGTMMKAVAETLKHVAEESEDWNWGGQIGFMSVLHTWTRTLEYHPHVHCLVPAGALLADGRWCGVDRPWLAPPWALANIFRATLCRMIRAEVPSLQLPGSIFTTPWVVHCDKPVGRTDNVLGYLGRYVNRGPLSESRILKVTKKSVTFKYRDGTRLHWQTMTLKGSEFLRRYLQHITPKGFHKVRYYGFWAKNARDKLKAIQEQLVAEGQGEVAGAVDAHAPQPAEEGRKCPVCKGRLCVVTVFRRGEPLPPINLHRKVPTPLPPAPMVEPVVLVVDALSIIGAVIAYITFMTRPRPPCPP